MIGIDGNDTLISGGGRDFLFGGDGEDQLFAGEGNDVLVGGEHADKLSGGTGEDELFGEAGDDHLAGGVKDDFTFEEYKTFFDDLDTEIVFDDEEKDILDGGEGNDTYYLFSKQEVVEDQSDWFTPFEATGGYSFFDAVLISNVDRPGLQKFDLSLYQNVDRIRDADGKGEIFLGYSAYSYDRFTDTVTKDYFLEEFSNKDYERTTSWGIDVYKSDFGMLYYDVTTKDLYGFSLYTVQEHGADIDGHWEGYHARFVIEDFDKGDFGIHIPLPSMGSESGETEAPGPENGEEDKGAFYHGLGGDDVILGTQGNDALRGDGGNDELSGSEGDDDLLGGDGHDTLDGGEGNDYLGGGDGDDVAHGGNGSDTVEAGAGNDIVTGGSGRDYLIGGTGNDRLDGGADEDTLEGGDGVDTLFGGGGDDTISGGAEGDNIHGGGGNDTIEGGTGDDVLAGGDGSDLYIYRLGDGNDTILEGYTATSNRVQMQDIALADVTFHRAGTNGMDLEARVISTGEKLLVVDFFDQEDGRGRISSFRFFDGEDRTANLSYNDIFALTNADNHVPIWADTEETVSVTPGSALSLSLDPASYSDADGDALSLTATLADGSDLPAWLSFDAASGTFTGTPPAGFGGTLQLRVAASDGKVSATKSITLLNSEGNAAPVVANEIDAQTAQEEGGLWTFQLPASVFADEDGSQLQLSAHLADGNRLPDWLSFNAESGTFSGYLPEEFHGAVGLEVVASDGFKTASAFFTLFIDEVNDPVFAADDRFYATVDAPLVLTADALSANDTDLDSGQFTIVSVQDAANCTVSLDGNGNVVVNATSQDLIEHGTFTYTISDGTNTSTASVTIDFVTESSYLGDLEYGTDGDDNLDLRYNRKKYFLDMGAGDDYVRGSTNNDIYFYDLGDGNDRIHEGGSSSHDRVFLSDAISVSDVTVVKKERNSGNEKSSLVLEFSDGGSLELMAQYNDNESLITGIEEVHFADGTVWGKEQLADMALASMSTDADDEITGFDDRNDTIEGGLGNDKIWGTEGNDTYLYDLGDGNDIIDEGDVGEGFADTLVFGAGIAADTITFSNYYDDVTLTFADGGSVTLDDQFEARQEAGIELFKFADGTIWGKDDLARLVREAAATSGDDTIHGFSDRGDVLEGGAGNDTIRGMDGDDTYLYDLGDGNDTIFDTYGDGAADRIVFGDGILASQVTVSRSQSDRDDVTLHFADGGSILLDEQFYETRSRKDSGVEQFVFNDGTVWTEATLLDILSQPQNRAPLVSNALADQTSNEDTAWTFTVPADSFSDADGDALTYSATLADGSALPAWIGFDADTRTFSGTPSQDFNGTLSLKVIASDGTASASDVFDLVIAPENDAPVVANDITGQSGTEDMAWSFTVPADAFTDVDGDALTYSATLADGSDLPTWLSFDAATRTFSGTPPQGTAGTLSLKVIASDGTLSAEDLFDLSIEAAAPSTTINVITGTDGKETLEGTDGNDILRAGGENDWLENSKGNDVLLGGDGYDQARFEGAASDYVFRWNKDGSFTATSAEYGVDTLHSINGIWFRGEGKWYRTEDLLPQHSSFKTFAGTDSYEFIYASHGDDIVVAGAGNDTIQPLGGNDIIFGDGDDHLHLEGARADYEFQWNPDGSVYAIHATDGVKILNGIDEVTFRGSGEWAWLNNLYVDPDSRTVVDGTSGNDTLAGTDFADVVEAGDGDDVIEGSAGDDTIFGGAGNDQVTYGGSAADVTVTENQDGTYTITSAAFGTDLLSGIETLYFSGENASYQLSALVSVTGGTSNLIEGTDGKETLEGTDGDDILRAGGENDWIRNSKGNDVLLGGDGYDQARFAGAASDYVFRWNKDGSFTATSAEYGVDTLHSINGIWFSGEGKWYRTEDLLPQHSSFRTFAGTDSYEFIYASHGDDIVVAGAGNDTIQPLGGNDILFGGDGTDHLHLEGARADYEFQWNPDGTIYVIHATDGVKILNGMEDVTFRGTGEWSTLEALYTDPDSRTVMVGTSGNETLTGTDLVDVIEAGSGDDVIDGGAGGDVLFGEAGSDTFVFQEGVTGHDTVGDFVAGAGTEDVLQFASSVFSDADAVLAAADTVGGNTVITVDGDTSITLLNVTKADLHLDDFTFV
ncbi:putative Ig domain-containing protein [Roseibium sp.]|uniref:putative Ig domain-containing protein n=1 Tax=Roseibium sp. TaxID=1936156 RepID=UPI003C7C034C